MQHVRSSLFVTAALLPMFVLGACNDAPTDLATSSAPAFSRVSAGTGEFVILGAAGALPADIEAQVAAAGGAIVRSYPELGLAVASSVDGGFEARASAIVGVESVTEDRLVEFIKPDQKTLDLTAEEAPSADVASLADNEPFYRYQWAPAAINAPEAWNAGYTGRGVRVAILDGGLFNAHPDLAANVDVATSRSFVPGFAYNQDVGSFWHGTHVAGIVAAADNSTGVIGIAPNATLIGVKVLHNGTGSFGWLIDAVMYASRSVADGGAGADIINMSLGALILDEKDQEDKAAIRDLAKALDRAMTYAWKNGTTVIAAAGNEYTNLDFDKFALSIPAMSQHVISVAATGPFGWAYGNTDYARLSSYSNWGKAGVDLAAPGGDFAWPTNELCSITGNTLPCWAFDMYLSTSRAGYTWAAGTSMASPVTAGVAALIIEKAGGSMAPALVEAELRRGALDLGKPGKDAVYGHGWVNAYNSVR